MPPAQKELITRLLAALERARAAADGATLEGGAAAASLFDGGEAGSAGLFDYINCSGVLHHLVEPEAGARALASVLAPHGALGVMVYGELGRIGVYHAQDMLRLVCGDAPLDQQVGLA